jgi:hypothetical protein
MLLLLSALAAPLAAQDSTRVRPTTAAAPPDSTQRPDSLRQRPDSARAATQVPVPRIRVPAPLQPPWRFQLDLGFQDIAGNRDLRVFNGAFTIERRRQDAFLLNTKLEARYGESNGSRSVDAQSARLRFDWHPRELVSPFLGLDFVRDPIRRIALRTQVGTGLNLNLARTDENRTLLSLGFVGDFQTYTHGVAPSHTEDTRIHLRAASTRLWGQAIRFDATAKVQPNTRTFEDYLATLDLQLRFSLTRRTGLVARYQYGRDSRPAPGVKPDDRTFDFSLSFVW